MKRDLRVIFVQRVLWYGCEVANVKLWDSSCSLDRFPMLTLTPTALPVLLAHSHIIQIPAMVMSIVGGLLIYGTIISFGMFFQEDQDF